MKKLLLLFLLTYSSALLSAEALRVYSSNYPLHYFAQRIGGEKINANYIVPEQIDPAFWQPTPEDIQALQQADLILLNGASYEKWLSSVSLPRRKLIDTSRSFQSSLLHVKNIPTHNHGIDGTHSHQGTAFTTWMDPNQALIQANTIKTAFVKKRPVDGQQFENNFLQLRQDLESLDKQWMHMLQTIQEQALLASHPVYQYLARRYHLKIHAMQWEPDSYPDEHEWQVLISYINDHPIKFMLWEAEPLNKTKQRLKQLGITVVVFSPAANKPEQNDWLEVMKTNSDALKKVLIQSAIIR